MTVKCAICSSVEVVYTGMHSNYSSEFRCAQCNNRFMIDNTELNEKELEEVRRYNEEFLKGKVPPATRMAILKTRERTNISGLARVKKKNLPESPKKEVKIQPTSQKAKPAMISRTVARTERTFKKFLPNIIPGYVERPAQIELAKKISLAMDKGQALLTEAGVGTGKSIAYLVPAIHYKSIGQPVVISTKTIDLQEQLTYKDIPSLKKAMSSADCFLVKGKGNYLCLKRYEENYYCIINQGYLNAEKMVELEDWAIGRTASGDRKKAPVTMSDDAWNGMNVNECIPKDCKKERVCPFMMNKKYRAIYEGIIVTNHNMLIDDLILRGKGQNGLWRDPCAIIIDEAHNFERAARNELSQDISIDNIFSIERKVRNIGVLRRHIRENVFNKVQKSVRFFLKTAKQLLANATQDENGVGYIPNDEQMLKAGFYLHRSLKDLYESIDIAMSFMDDHSPEINKIERLQSNIGTIKEKLDNWIGVPKDYYLSGKMAGKNLKITISPISAGEFLNKNLWHTGIPVILTSGTLATDQSFENIRVNLGIEEAVEYISDPSRTSEDNVALYIATDMPKPPHADEEDDEIFTVKCAEKIAQLLKCSQGRSLVLFTSHRRMNKIYKILENRKDIPWKLIHQRDRNAAHKFRTEETSILLATGAYWEGIDVVGDALNLVIMDKLPFPNPHDPLIAAKELILKEQPGVNTFQQLYIPEMVLQLKQGSGRLLRRETDWGAIAILDPRAGKGYRDGYYYGLVKKALPPHTELESVYELKTWFALHRSLMPSGF